MKYQPFAESDKRVSRLGYGAMGLAGLFGQYDEAYFIRSILLSLEQGINFIDTARAYGRSEEFIGKALKQWGGERPFLATKVLACAPLASMPPGSGWQHPVPSHIAYPPGRIRTSVEESLNQLGVGEVDLIQLHQYLGLE